MSVATVDPEDTLAVLVAAREWLSDPEHWTTGEFYRDAAGEPVDSRALVARTCVEGAIAFVVGLNVTESFRPIRPTVRLLGVALGRWPCRANDHYGYDAVMAGLDKAIATERERRIA